MDLIQRKTQLSENIPAFCRYLRSKGLGIGPADSIAALQALTTHDFRDREGFRLILRAVLTRSVAEQRLFDQQYEEYWRNLEKAVDSKVKAGDELEQQQRATPKPDARPKALSIQNWLKGSGAQEEAEMASYSAGEVMTQKDFSTFAEEDLREVMRLITRIARSLAKRKNRRYQASRKHQRLDLRRTIRGSLRTGGEVMELAYRGRKPQRLKLVLLCDVSKSMDLYSRFLIQFTYAFQQVYKRVETFVFSTSLHRISEALRERDFAFALDRLAQEVPDWSGGTRIGASFKAFVEQYGPRMLDNRTVVLILSDGWDTGDTEILAESMRHIHQKAARVVWLNPLAGNPQFSPTVQGMQAAMPYIDVFAPCHNVESLKEVVRLTKL